MDISGIASAGSAMAQAQTGDAVAILVMKKALEMQAQGALQLVQAAAQSGAANNPAHLGQNVDIRA